MYDYQKAQSLKAARRKDARETLRRNKGTAKNTIHDAKSLVKSATPWSLFLLLLQANIITDWMYGMALLAAIFKDLLDWTELTGVGYIIILILTLLISIFIALMMILGSIMSAPETSRQGMRQRKTIRSWLILLTGTGAEMLFGVNILPIETMTVLIVYALVLLDRKRAREGEREEERTRGGTLAEEGA